MQYMISFLEGIITFISPCLLPMLPIYISYFAGGGERSTKKTMKCALGFILGFTIVFVSMGALAGTIGSFLKSHQQTVNIVSGVIVILFGLNFLGILKINLFHGAKRSVDTTDLGFFTSALFGIIFSVGWTPCVGAFLGSALMLASLGLGIPFIISALLIDKLKSTFAFIKRNYRIINTICGGFLIVIGILMATGTMGRFLALLS